MSHQPEQAVYERQGFGQRLELLPPAGLLVVDFVIGFADPKVFGGGNIRPAIEKTRKLLALARKRSWLVSYSRIVYADDGSDANVFTDKIPGCLKFTENSDLSQIVPELPPLPGDLIIRKQFPSAFFGTHLASSLAMHGIKTLFISGATTSGCVRASAVDAMCHGFRPVIVEDCVGDRSIAQHEANLFDMKMKYTENMSLEQVEALTSL